MIRQGKNDVRMVLPITKRRISNKEKERQRQSKIKPTAMGLLDFFRKKKPQQDTKSIPPTLAPIDKSQWMGKDFEFLIRGEISVSEDEYDHIMTPNSLVWTKTFKDSWPYYQVGQDEFSYSWEMPGIQMIFNKEMPYEKAKRIAEEVVSNIRSMGQDAELVGLDKRKVNKF